MRFKADEIARFLNAEVIGDKDITVDRVSKIEEAKPGSLTFLSVSKYESFLYTTEASVVIISKEFVPCERLNTTLIVVEDAYQALAALLEFYNSAKANRRTGIEQPSFMHESSQLGDLCWIAAFAYVGRNVKIGNRVKIYPHVYVGDNVILGDDVILYSGVKIYDDCIIGNRCTIHAGSVIGSDGFGFAPQSDGTYKKIQQIGNVIIEDDVEIGANTTIDCGTIDATIIRKGVKIDNLIQIGHNCEVGENTVMAAQTGLAGTTKVGKNCRFAGQVGIAGHIVIGDNVQLGAQTGVTKSISSNKTVLATPAMEHSRAVRVYSIYRNLPELRQEIIALQKEMKEIKENL